MDDSFLLSDGEVAEFIVKGYHLVEPELPAGLNESIADQLDALDHNPGDAITEAVLELWQVLRPSAGQRGANQPLRARV